MDVQVVVLLDEEVQEGLPDLLGCLLSVHHGLSTPTVYDEDMTSLQQI